MRTGRRPALENVRDVPNVVTVGLTGQVLGPSLSFMTETATAPSAAGPSSIAVLTSGGDAGGMNPAIRAVVRTAVHHGIDVYAVAEGYLGLIQGGDAIRRVESADVGGILQRGGTILGTARSMEFRERDGRRRAARNLLDLGVDALVVIGGDGSLTGANLLREEWPELLSELVDAGEVHPEVAAAHPFLRLVGLVGSIDNDMFGTDMTIGADTALHRITEALDAILSTAASHQRTFVVEVMGRHCGYLALMGSLATGANWVVIPERPPERDDWGSVMCSVLRAGRDQGRRQNVVLVAEGAQDRDGKPITAQDLDGAMRLRGGSFRDSFSILMTMQQAAPRPTAAGRRRFRLAVVHGGGPAPGMNTAVRAAVRLGLDRGYTVLAVNNGFRGLRDGDIQEMQWMSVSGWVSSGGADIGTNRYVPSGEAIAQTARQLGAHRVDGLLMIGGWAGYQAAHVLHSQRRQYPELDIPIVCLPATINNDLPATELSIGADTALNSIVADVDKIKQSAVASLRCFVVEVMGRDCGYLALMSALASGAERVYLPEEGITLDDLTAYVEALTEGFRSGKRLGLVIRSENADPVYTTGFLTSLFEKEGGELFDAREAILGHIQEGGNPSPFDRIQATRLTARCIDFLSDQLESGTRASAMIGFQSGRLQFTDLTSYPTLVQQGVQRPVEQRWMAQRPLAQIMTV